MVYGYTYEIKTDNKKSILYEDLPAYGYFRGMGIFKENIRVDIIGEMKKTTSLIRPEFDNLINAVKKYDCIVFINLKHLGRTPREFQIEWEKIVIDKGVDVLFLDDEYVSSCDRSYKRFIDKERLNIVLGVLSSISNIDRSRFGSPRVLKDGINNSYEKFDISRDKGKFQDAYWKWQLGDYNGTMAAESLLISRKVFYEHAKKYEQTDEYMRYLENNENVLMNEPKRGYIPERFIEIEKGVTQEGKSIEEACREAGLDKPLSQVEYFRCLLAQKPIKKSINNRWL